MQLASVIKSRVNCEKIKIHSAATLDAMIYVVVLPLGSCGRTLAHQPAVFLCNLVIVILKIKNLHKNKKRN